MLNDEDLKMTEVVKDGVRMNISMEEWEKDMVNIDFDEWLVSEMTEMYNPQLVTRTSQVFKC